MRRPPPALKEFLAAYDEHVVRLFLEARNAVLATAPEAVELVYDAYNAVAAAYSFTDRLAHAFCHVAAYTGHVNLGFNHGAELDDPDGLLAGSGRRIRHVRILQVEDLRRPGVRRLVRAAAVQGRRLAPAEATPPRSIIKPVKARKRRPR